MKLFELKTAIILFVLVIIIQIIATNFIHYYSSDIYQTMTYDNLLRLVVILILIIYAFAYILKWNKGEAKFP